VPLAALDEDLPAEAALRAEVRAFMEEHAAPYGLRTGAFVVSDEPEHIAANRAWQRTLDAGGWGAPSWPAACGGKDFGPNELRIFHEEERRWAVPTGALHTSVVMVGPTIIAHGTPDQQERYLAPTRGGDIIWCQLFSEPDAGSDLASLRTRATRVEGGWLVTGQKIWTSGAHYSDRAILLARTDPESHKHEGITYFLADMRSPGIEVRPIVQINRGRHFNEVYLDEVFVADDDVLGHPGGGWPVARTTLGAERVLIAAIRVDDRVEALVEQARRSGRLTEPSVRGALADAYVRARVLGLTSERVLAAIRTGGTIGPEASVLKLALSRLIGDLGALGMAVLGPHAMLESDDGSDGYGSVQDQFLAQWGPRIGGGTEQIQRNLVAERALGLPRDRI
jgi:alkylation response protein AidB-like acyl-CoA dehydrogenase